MTLAENIAKFSRIVAAHPEELKRESINEVVRALVIADTAHRGDADRGRYEHLGLQELSKSGIKEFEGVCLSEKTWGMEMSDVMQMRIMCDVLTLLLASDDVDYAMRYSADVAKAMGRRERTKRVDYLPFDICERILDHYLEGIGFDEGLRDVFERTSSLLKDLRELQPKIDSSRVGVSDTNLGAIWLPKDFSSHGFNVSTRIPVELERAKGDIRAYASVYNSSFMLEALIHVLTGKGSGDTARWAFMNRLQDVGETIPALFPIGIGVDPGIRNEVYTPFHFLDNQSLRVIYMRYFTRDKKASFDGVAALIQAFRAWKGIS